MTAAVSEGYLSRDGVAGQSDSRELIYYSFNEADESAAAAAVAAVAPATYDGMPGVNVARKQITETVYQWTLTYGVDQKQTQPSNPSASEFNTTLSFNIVGGTVHLTNSETGDYTTYVISGNDEIDFKGAIGVDPRGKTIRGVDAFAPVLDYSYATQFANAVVTNDYIDDVFELTGKTNIAEFYGRPAGSVLFKGARGSRKGRNNWELSFEFAYSKNRTGIVIGEIDPFDKLGWEYMDVFYSASDSITVGGVSIPLLRPLQVTIHEIYHPGDFDLLLIGDGT